MDRTGNGLEALVKTGRTLVELAQEIERQANAKRDYLVQTAAVEVVPVVEAERPEDRVLLTVPGGSIEPLGINSLAHEQLDEWAEIPRKYYRRMLDEQPALLANNLNTWLRAKPATRMVRSLDGRARAWLSNVYRPMDYVEMAEAVLPVLRLLDLEILSCEVTERRLYLKAVDRRITLDLPTGRKMGDGSHVFFDTLSPALVISNSEVGCGALSVEAGVWTKVCTNLAIASQRSMRKYHLGARADLGAEVMALLSDDTRRKTDAALWAQVRDVVKAAFDRAKFEALVDSWKGATEQKIEGDPVKVVEVVSKKLAITDGERPSVLRHLIEGGDLSQYGLFNAITRTAEDLPDYDRATEFERLGGKVIELSPADWKPLATAA